MISLVIFVIYSTEIYQGDVIIEKGYFFAALFTHGGRNTGNYFSAKSVSNSNDYEFGDYGLLIGQKEVTAQNKDNILGDETATAKYDTRNKHTYPKQL